jgi:hypothetical protein
MRLIMIELNDFSCRAVSGGEAVMVYSGTKDEFTESAFVALGVTLGGFGAIVGGNNQGPVGALCGALLGALVLPAATVGVCKGLATTYRYLGLI